MSARRYVERWIEERRTFVISMLMLRIVCESCGNLTSWLESFMISVDFWRWPVILSVAASQHTYVSCIQWMELRDLS